MRQSHIKHNTAFLLHHHYGSRWLRFLLPEVSEPQRMQICAVLKNETKPTLSIVRETVLKTLYSSDMEGNKKYHCCYTSLNPLHGAQYSLQVTAKRDNCFRTQVPSIGIPV